MKAKMLCRVAALVLVFSLAAAVVPAGTAKAATLCVNPGGTGGCYTSIQAAINAANPAGGDIIIVAAGTYTEHDITINKSLTIQGAGAGSTFIDGQDISRVFYINQSTVDMSGMTIRNGNVTGTSNGGGIYNNMGNVTLTECTISNNQADAGKDGGGIANYMGNMTLTNCTISGNNAYAGGGIWNNGNLTMTNCTVSENNADGAGGIRNSINGDVTLTNCTISGNSAHDDNGGGIFNQGTLNGTNCTISDNDTDTGDDGGGIYNTGNVTLTNCTVSGNEADNGGGIYNDGGQVTMTDCTVSDNTARAGNGGGIGTPMADRTLTMTNCTISGNNASGDGGGIYNYLDEVTLTNCTVSDNEAGDDGGGIANEFGDLTLTCTIVYGNRASGSMKDVYNIFNGGGTYNATESIVGDPYGDPDPLLGPLQYNGGPTKTHALMPGSPAIDGCNTNCTVAADQRGISRPQLIACDVGAYEKQPPVGGTIEPVDKIGILAPWLGLAAFLAIAMVVVVLFMRRRLA